MANFFFDGSANVLAQKADTVLITGNPALFTSSAQVGANVVITYNNGTTLTVQNTTLSDLPGVQLSNGTFSSGSSVALTTTTNSALVFGPTAGLAAAIDVSGGGTSTSIKTVFGGLGVSDPSDLGDSIVIGGKGSFLIYGNAGSDNITQNGAFDSQSFVTVFGGKNDANGATSDSITLTGGNVGAKMAIYGGEGTDTINIVNSGVGANTTIFGGQGAIDSTDSADTITFNGGGTVQIFGNAGNDSISIGTTAPLITGSTATIHGGIGADSIDVKGAGTLASSSITVFGDENTTGVDTLIVGGNAGTTTIYGGRAAADADDGVDSINYSGQGTANIFAAGGNDSVVVSTGGVNLSGADSIATVGQGGAGVTAAPGSSTNVFLGNGNDSITILNASTATGVTTVNGGAGDDVFTIGNNLATAASVTAGSAGTGLSTVVIDKFGEGLDTIRINNGAAAVGGTVTGDTTTYTSLTAALNAAANGAGNANATVVTFDNNSYIVLNRDGGNDFVATADLAIKLTGVSNVTAIAGATTLL